MGQQGLHLSGIALTVFLLAMWSFDQSELQSLRPQHGDVSSHTSGQLLDVPARLWQDPFDAVKRAQQAHSRAQVWSVPGNVSQPVQGELSFRRDGKLELQLAARLAAKPDIKDQDFDAATVVSAVPHSFTHFGAVLRDSDDPRVTGIAKSLG